MKLLIEQLFATDALALTPEDEPFWYTSGKLGPFYINTHYLAGGKVRAEQLLNLIEEAAQDPTNLVNHLMGEFLHELENNQAFHQLMVAAKELLESYSFDVISGGERRDFFFSLPLAYLLSKPHLSILKDGRLFYSDDVLSGEPAKEAPNLTGKRVLHVADIVTKASSFTRQWIPAIKGSGATIKHAFAILDRHQGGEQALAQLGVSLTTLGDIDERFFAQAEATGRLSSTHRQAIQVFLNDPDGYMANFLKAHPDFLKEQLARGGKSAERAQLAIESGYAD